MRIAQISPIIERVPPKKYGGTERVVFELTEELVRRGHDVTLFASGDSLTSAKLVSVTNEALREQNRADLYFNNVISMMHIGVAYKHQEEFDLIHDHNGFISLPTAQIANTPVIMTYHGYFSETISDIHRKLDKPGIVSISKSQVASISGLNVIGTVYNGQNMDVFPFSENHDGYLLFAGRISKEKGVHFAIEAAKRLKLPLIIAAKLDIVDKAYFKKHIEPNLGGNIRWIGEVDNDERNELMTKAMCFLHPITFKEPFGLTMIESLACGCPVVAFNKGSVPEIIQNGINGFVVDDLDGMIEGIRNIGIIDRSSCRASVISKFNVKQMVDGYEAIYEKVLKQKNA